MVASRRRSSPLARRAGHAVGRELQELGVVGPMRAGRRENWHVVADGKPGQSSEFHLDLARARDKEGPFGVHEVALGVDVEENKRACEHGLVPRLATANSCIPHARLDCHNIRSAWAAPHDRQEIRV